MKQSIAAAHAKHVANLTGQKTYVLKTRNGTWVWYFFKARPPRPSERVEVFQRITH